MNHDDLHELLTELHDYMANRADASCEPGDDRYRGNAEMGFMSRLGDALLMPDSTGYAEQQLDVLKELRADLFYQVESRHGAKAASEYPSIVKADALLALRDSQGTTESPTSRSEGKRGEAATAIPAHAGKECSERGMRSPEPVTAGETAPTPIPEGWKADAVATLKRDQGRAVWFVVLPSHGGMLRFGFQATPEADECEAKFVADAINAALSTIPEGNAQLVRDLAAYAKGERYDLIDLLSRVEAALAAPSPVASVGVPQQDVMKQLCARCHKPYGKHIGTACFHYRGGDGQHFVPSPEYETVPIESRKAEAE